MNYELTQDQRRVITERTQHYIDRANELLGLKLSAIEVNFDLKGGSSGMFMVRSSQIRIRYNEIIFSQYFDDALDNTVGHEVAHYVVYSIYGLRKTRPHGIEWKQVMQLFNLRPEVTSRYDVSQLPLKQQRRHNYACGCMTHELSTTRHYKILRGKMTYHCRKCQQPLKQKA
ncbi:MAG TPA: metallopeptidase (SprT family) [Gammaproteobacteria bacterium]|nr:metallopeptidase (SprT family) [Gammaproteobacteria bacterium]